MGMKGDQCTDCTVSDTIRGEETGISIDRDGFKDIRRESGDITEPMN